MRRLFFILTVLSVSAWAQPPAPAPAQSPIVVQVQMPPTPNRDFLGYLQSLGPLIAACVAVGVALMQRHLQHRQLKQNLFDKRFEVYSAVRRLLLALLENGLDFVDGVEWDRFLSETSPAKFLFGPEVTAFINEIKASDATTVAGTYGKTIRHIQVGPDTEADDAATVFMRWRAKAELAFGPYLDLQPSPLPWYARLEAYMNRLADSGDRHLKSRYENPPA